MKREQRGYNNSNNSSGLTIIDVQNDDDETYTLDIKNARSSFFGNQKGDYMFKNQLTPNNKKDVLLAEPKISGDGYKIIR